MPASHRTRRTYRGLLRVDGQSTWRQAVTPRNGGDTLPPFVIIVSDSERSYDAHVQSEIVGDEAVP